MNFGSFHKDIKILAFDLFLSRVSSLPELSEILSLRSRYLKGDKMQKEEREYGRKSLNHEQLKYFNSKNEDDKKKEVFKFIDSKKNNLADYLKKRGDKNVND